MFNKSILAAALLTVGAIAGGTAASAAEFGVRHQHGTSWSNTYNGVRVYESDTKSSTVRDLRAGTVTLSASGDDSVGAADLARAISSPTGQGIVREAFLGLAALEPKRTPALIEGSISAGDPQSPPSATDGGGLGGGLPLTTGTDEGVTASFTASLLRESYRGATQTQLNESNNFDSGSLSTFSSVSTFAN